MHDAVALEEHGIPTAVICSEAFLKAGQEQATALGMESFSPIVVEHPIQSLTPKQIRTRAESVVDRVVKQLSNQP